MKPTASIYIGIKTSTGKLELKHRNNLGGASIPTYLSMSKDVGPLSLLAALLLASL